MTSPFFSPGWSAAGTVERGERARGDAGRSVVQGVWAGRGRGDAGPEARERRRGTVNMAYRRAPRWAWWLAVLVGMVFGLLLAHLLERWG
jgi:hypothetical protein